MKRRDIFTVTASAIAVVAMSGSAVQPLLGGAATPLAGVADRAAPPSVRGLVERVADQRSEAAAPASLPPELKMVKVGTATAHFGGTKPENAPLRFGVEALWFTFDGNPKRYVFTPSGTLYFSDWRFEIFSPDGRHVLLLQDRFGPYHVVSLERLKNYLEGEAKPNHVFGDPKSEEVGSVKEKARWMSDSVIEYVASCCGTADTRQYRIPK